MPEPDLVSVRVAGFLPSRNGFRFNNDFPAEPYLVLRPLGMKLPIGDASSGMCGGMAFAVRDFFERGDPIPESEVPPSPGSPLFNYLLRRLWDSFRLPGGPFRYYSWMGMTDDKIRRKTMRDGWLRIKGELDRGDLSPLGFNRRRSRNPLHLGHNHQVLAYGYDWAPASGKVDLLIYDPDHAKDDDITLTFHLHGPEAETGIVNSTGATVRGFFHTAYRPPGFAWLSWLMGLHGPEPA